MFSYGIRGLRERAEEIAGSFSVEWNTVVVGYVGDGVEKFVGEGVEELGRRRRRAENYESTVEGNVGIGESSVGDRVRDKKAGIFKGLRMTAERLKMSADNINLRRRDVIEYLHCPIVGMEVYLL
mgnify:FL=1